jgi:ubiquinone/menaquinone biosynthesis C-methylase UbiE
MFVKVPLVFLLSMPFTSAFRSPENAQTNVKLPEIKRNKITISPEVHDPPSDLIVFPKMPEAVLLQQFYPKQHRRWGIDKDQVAEYWNDARIHTLGNIGFFGALHAALAPISTKMIDMVAYNGTDVRFMVAEELSTKIKSSQARVADLCCGVGFSTQALRKAFPNAETVIGVDTSNEMITMAKFLSLHLATLKPIVNFFSERVAKICGGTAATFKIGNAENTLLPAKSFDLVTIMYAFHEAPREGRERILQEAYRLLEPGGMVAVLDISTEYTPSSSMLAGEPYVLEYQKNIHSQIRAFRGFDRVTYKNIVPSHVGMWLCRKSGSGTWQ